MHVWLRLLATLAQHRGLDLCVLHKGRLERSARVPLVCCSLGHGVEEARWQAADAAQQPSAEQLGRGRGTVLDLRVCQRLAVIKARAM